MTQEKYVHFVANYDDWVAIKKLKIEDKTDPKTIMEFLAGLTNSVDKKIEQNLRKMIDLSKLDTAISELGIKKRDIIQALQEVSSRKINAVINEITEKQELQKNEQKELQDFCKVYATRKLLKECGLAVDYTRIEIPGMKKLKKAKVE